jgi:hypothetical protein
MENKKSSQEQDDDKQQQQQQQQSSMINNQRPLKFMATLSWALFVCVCMLWGCSKDSFYWISFMFGHREDNRMNEIIKKYEYEEREKSKQWKFMFENREKSSKIVSRKKVKKKLNLHNNMLNLDGCEMDVWTVLHVADWKFIRKAKLFIGMRRQFVCACSLQRVLRTRRRREWSERETKENDKKKAINMPPNLLHTHQPVAQHRKTGNAAEFSSLNILFLLLSLSLFPFFESSSPLKITEKKVLCVREKFFCVLFHFMNIENWALLNGVKMNFFPLSLSLSSFHLSRSVAFNMLIILFQ